ITNIDLETEYKYLIVLNNELENTDKDTMLELAKESIIREKLKKNEILNYYELNGKQDYLDDVVKDYYERLNIKNLNDFQNYLSEYGLKLENVVKKIEIELMWNKLIGYKYSSQININEKLLKEQIENSSKNDKIITEYELSEILFQANSDSELSNKINLIQQDINKQGFKNSANIHSLSDSSKFGGNIGWFNEKQLSKKINLIIEKLDVGEVSKPIQIANNFLILKIENKKQKKNKLNKKKLLKEAILFEQNKQYSQFSIIHFNKVKINSIISE
ncbi:peptidylprolyl isomerase, partial [Candidatus Pelagibacter sp.]|nr:peptidylprolyl isomerase [Candidatus Pelagibacter sp.]